MTCSLLLSIFVSAEAQFIPNKQLQPKETQIYIKLVKYAMQALDIYQVRILTDVLLLLVSLLPVSFTCFALEVFLCFRITYPLLAEPCFKGTSR